MPRFTVEISDETLARHAPLLRDLLALSELIGAGGLVLRSGERIHVTPLPDRAVWRVCGTAPDPIVQALLDLAHRSQPDP